MSSSTSIHVEPETSSSNEPPFNESIIGSLENVPEESNLPDYDGDAVPAINDLKSLEKGIIKTSRNKAQAPYTILLVGETGTGKSSLLEFIANVLIGNPLEGYNFNIIDQKNEQGGSGGQSQTNSPRIYELTSQNGILVRVLDAPGLADTRGIHQDELHKKSIAAEIQNHIDSVTAVLILANGSVPRITVGMDYTLAALSALFPKTLAKNVAFLFTNSSTYLSLNFAQDTIPEILKGAPQFLLDNPIALQKKFLKFKDDPNKKKMRKEMQKEVKNAERRALEMLVNLFDWLDGLEPQPTTEIVALCKKSRVIVSKITNALTQMDQASTQRAEIKKLVDELQKKSADVDRFSNFKRIVNAPVWKRQPAPTLNYLCIAPDCHSNCGVKHSVIDVFLRLLRQFSSCSKCNHRHLSHSHLHSTWEEVYEDRVSVDDNMRKQLEDAKEEKKRIEALLRATSKSALETSPNDHQTISTTQSIIEAMLTSTSVHVEPKPSSSNELPFNEPIKDSVGPLEYEPEESDPPDHDGDAVPAIKINDVESLRKGIIKTSKNKEQVGPYTILLVGETGTGKSSVLEFIANVLIGNPLDGYNFNILDQKNEQGGSSGQSKTNLARIYELTSNNGIVVRVLDAPGLADTRGIHQDELHKQSTAAEIQNHISSVTAVLILANGSVPRITAGTDYALSALSSLFPKTLAKNIAFLFTNSSTYLSLNFPQDAIPEILQDAPQFLVDNPMALEKKFRGLKDDPNKKKLGMEMQNEVKNAEQRALETLVNLFDWLDGLEPQPTTDIVALYEKSRAIESKITNALTRMEQASTQMTEINKLVGELQKKSADMHDFSKFEGIINALVWRQQPAPTLNYLCLAPNCHSTCGVKHSVTGVFLLFPRQFSSCSKCNHPHLSHFHLHSTWEQVYGAQLSVDDDTRRQWEAAKDEKERTEALIATSRGALGDLSRIIDEAMDELARLAEEYASLSLSGSFSAPLEKTVWLLEQRCKGMEEKGVGLEQLTKVRSSLEHMKGRLDLLRKARIAPKKAIRSTMDPFSLSTGVMGLVAVALKLVVGTLGIIDKTVAAYDEAADELKGLQQDLEQLQTRMSRIHGTLSVLLSNTKDRGFKKLLRNDHGQSAVRELCEALEMTLSTLTEMTDRMDESALRPAPLPADKKSLQFIRAVLKHSITPSKIADLVKTLRDMRSDVQTCATKLEATFQHVHTFYDMMNNGLARITSQTSLTSTSTNLTVRIKLAAWLKRWEGTWGPFKQPEPTSLRGFLESQHVAVAGNSHVAHDLVAEDSQTLQSEQVTDATGALAGTSNRAVKDLGRIINDATDDLAQSANEYAPCASAGGCPEVNAV